ncbi:hypothetical protein ABW21_db0209324 [Orbilia brochopaga]|nr:hypothetical protein ABW21_db0209324 [Drechslerella brochopaga]
MAMASGADLPNLDFSDSTLVINDHDLGVNNPALIFQEQPVSSGTSVRISGKIGAKMSNRAGVKSRKLPTESQSEYNNRKESFGWVLCQFAPFIAVNLLEGKTVTSLEFVDAMLQHHAQIGDCHISEEEIRGLSMRIWPSSSDILTDDDLNKIKTDLIMGVSTQMLMLWCQKINVYRTISGLRTHLKNRDWDAVDDLLDTGLSDGLPGSAYYSEFTNPVQIAEEVQDGIADV